MREKSPNTQFFLVGIFLYSDWIQENTDQKKLRIGTLFTQRKIWETSKIFANIAYCKRQKQPQEVFCKKKEALVHVFFCKFCKISKNIFFTDHIWATASALFNLPELKIYTKNKHVKVSEIPNFQNTYVLTIKNM